MWYIRGCIFEQFRGRDSVFRATASEPQRRVFRVVLVVVVASPAALSVRGGISVGPLCHPWAMLGDGPSEGNPSVCEMGASDALWRTHGCRVEPRMTEWTHGCN